MATDDVERWSRPFAWLYSLMSRNPRSNREVVRMAAPTPGEHALDVGCGPGAAVRRAATAGADTLGVDPSAAMVDIARRRSRRHATARFEVGDAAALPVDDDTIDVAWTIASYHWPDRDAGLAELHRVLRPGGRLLVAERRLRSDGHGLTSQQAAGVLVDLEQRGFRDAAMHEVRIWPARMFVVTATA